MLVNSVVLSTKVRMSYFDTIDFYDVI